MMETRFSKLNQVKEKKNSFKIFSNQISNHVQGLCSDITESVGLIIILHALLPKMTAKKSF